MSIAPLELEIILPENRYNPGKMVLRNEHDQQLMPEMPCLGKADNGRAIQAGNQSRSPLLPYGDTPTGLYKPAHLIIFEFPHRRLGRGWIPLQGEAGEAGIAMEVRSGLGIHAGRGGSDKDRLIPTYGCIRMFDDDFDALEKVVRNNLIRTVIRPFAGIVEADRSGVFPFDRHGNSNPEAV